jgi:STE24 endopeptidase
MEVIKIMSNTILIFIVIILIFDYLFERILDILNASRWSNEVPDELKGIYDSEKYKKSQEYHKANNKFSFITSTVSFILIIIVLLTGGFKFLDNFLRQYTENPIILALLFFGILGLASDLIMTPFSVYDTFVIEQKFGFNTTTPKTFILDKLKTWLLVLIIGGGLLALFITIYNFFQQNFWWIAWIVLTIVSVFFTMFYSEIIVPLFNKQTPLENGELRDEIERFANKAGFKLKNIYVIDGSKRSKKANAYFTGLGTKKRIVLYDTLINEHTKEELVAVLAHEIGHYKKKHTLKNMIFSVFETGLMLFILSLFIGKPEMSLAIADIPSLHIGLLVFGILYSPLSLIIGIITNVISRKYEYEADKYAGVNYNPEHLILALKNLSVNNLSNLNPHPFYVFIHYSHPTLLQRIKELKKI